MEENGNGYEPQEIDLKQYVNILKHRRLTIFVCLLAVVAAAMAWTFTRDPIYQSESRILVKGNDPINQGDFSTVFPALAAFRDQRDVQTQVEIIRSWPLLKEAATRAGLEVEDGGSMPVKVEGGKDTNVIKVTATSTDPSLAQRLANQVATVYVDRNLNQNRSSAHAGRVFLEAQQQRFRTDLEEAARELRDYQERTGAVGLDVATASRVQNMSELESSRTAALAERSAAEARVAQLRNELRGTDQTVIATTQIQANPQIQTTATKIADLSAQRAGLLEDYAPTSSRVTALDAQIAEAEARQRELVDEMVGSRSISINPVHQQLVSQIVDAEGQALGARARASGLERSIGTQRSALSQVPEQMYRLAQLERRVQTTEKTYLALQDRYQQLRIAEESTLANAQVIEPALLPKQPISPRPKLNLVLAILVGLMLGIGIAALQEALDNSLQSGEDVERELGLPLLGMVGTIDSPELRSLVHADSLSNAAESFRMVRSNIKFMGVDKNLRTLMVTSSGKGEGKSTTAVNLAIALAQDGKRITLVDADLRRPSVHRQFGIPNTTGLTNSIVGGEPLAEVTRDVDVENLSVITAGPIPPNPAELLDSARFARLMEELRTTNDIVVFDAPPLLGVADASVLGGAVDGVVMVVAASEVDRNAARRALQMLQQARAHVLGVVLNKVKQDRGGQYYNYYYYQYMEYTHKGGGKRGRKKGTRSIGGKV
jgi:polysaccharide biosynthesis transport protein